jgi:pimeloyl-ACP methyl ester carboxylesterase
VAGPDVQRLWGNHVLSRTARLNQVVRLADGRALGYAEYGPATGPALLLFHGLPGSRLAAAEMWPMEHPLVRVVAPDRPGFGLSTFQPGRRLTDWAGDVGQLADSLGLDRFLVAGFSGGGPHALAVAQALPQRVIAAGVISGMGTLDSLAALQGMSRTNQVILTLARRLPQALWLMSAPHARAMRRRPGQVLDKAAADKHLPAADRATMADPQVRDRMIAAAPEDFRHGTRGFIHEAHIAARPWGFDPATIQPPVHFWHGDRDVNVPVALARNLAARVPGSSLTIYPGEGHLIVPKHWDEITATLLSAT